MRFMLVDDSEPMLRLMATLLEGSGHEVVCFSSPQLALQEAPQWLPDCVLLDLMMPELDGFEVCRRLRLMPTLDRTRIVVISGKSYDYDKRRARQLGADGFIAKPINAQSFQSELDAILKSCGELTYWGARGTLPVPGAGSLRYGGNTSCVTLELPNEPLLIFDAGSGIKHLSDHLLAQQKQRLTAKIFISHPHWDHINALPFFAPLYQQGNEIEILGPAQGDKSIRTILSAQMDDVYFPITIREFGARVFFRDLREETVDFGGFQVDTLLLSHPGNCLGYRVRWQERTFCYITDNELFPADAPSYYPHYVDKLAEFVAGADILTIDTTYLDEEYPRFVGWGHSATRPVVELAARAEVKHLHLFHHDPSQDDAAIDRKQAEGQRQLQELGSPTRCLCAAEGGVFTL